MKVAHPRISELFRRTIAELARDGVAPSPQESVWLWQLCERCIARDFTASSYCDREIECEGTTFREPSIGAMMWLDDCASEWFAEGLYALLAEGYALANGRKPGAFAKMWDSRASAARELRRWYRESRFTLSQLRSVVEVFGGETQVDIPSPNEQGQPAPCEWGALVSAVCQKYPAIRPEDIMYRYPMAVVTDLLRRARNGDGSEIATAMSLYDNEALRLAMNKVRQSHGAG